MKYFKGLEPYVNKEEFKDMNDEEKILNVNLIACMIASFPFLGSLSAQIVFSNKLTLLLLFIFSLIQAFTILATCISLRDTSRLIKKLKKKYEL